MPMFLPDYDQLAIHKLMLSDRQRMSAYRTALDRLAPGRAVLDVGTGTGILAIMAARAGAKRVYAMEKGAIATVARKLIAESGYGNVIELLRGDPDDFTLPERCDLLVSEWMGVHALQEDVLDAVIRARNKHMKPGYSLVPRAVDIWAAPMKSCPVLEQEVNAWHQPVEGIACGEILNLSQNDCYVGCVKPDDLVHGGVKMHSIDPERVGSVEPFSVSLEFPITRDERVSGLCGWFCADLGADTTLSTSPFDAPTHWQQSVYPCYPPIAVSRGEVLRVDFEAAPRGTYSDFSWSFEATDRKQSYSMSRNYLRVPTSNLSDSE